MTWADTRLHIVLVVCATLLYGGSHPLGGEEGPEKDRERQLVEAWYETYDSIVESFEVRSDDGRVEDGGLQRETILTVYNPEFSMRHGRIYLWTDEGRPTVIGSIMSGITARSSGIRAINYEFHSLARRPVSVGRAGTVYWKCEKPRSRMVNRLHRQAASSKSGGTADADEDDRPAVHRTQPRESLSPDAAADLSLPRRYAGRDGWSHFLLCARHRPLRLPADRGEKRLVVRRLRAIQSK